jgi:uncharacterized protein YcbX
MDGPAAVKSQLMPTLARITIYPVKSLDGIETDVATVLPGGALENDRRWRLVDMDGRVVNAKRTPVVHAVRADFDLALRTITLAVDAAAIAVSEVRGIARAAALARGTFPLVPGPTGPCGWLSEAIGFPVLLEERRDGGFPDDRDASGPTLVSTASLEEVARWYGFALAECRRRFRVNLELGGCDAFWEDTLASPARPELSPALELPVDPYADLPPPEPREFAVGAARFRATYVCRRCPVPGRDSRTGAAGEWFSDIFEARRRQGLRADVDAAAWDTLYRLAVNTVGASGVETGITVGDTVG